MLRLTFFSNIMGIEPLVVACTVLPKPDGGMKDAGRNIMSAREFVVNLVSEQMAADHEYYLH